MKKAVVLLCAFVTAWTVASKAQLLSKQQEQVKEAELWADSVMNTLSLREKAAQLFFVNLAPTQTEHCLKLVDRYMGDMGLGGVYFSRGTLAEHIVMYNRSRAVAKTPPMVCIDGEWGVSMRVKDVPAFPRNAIIGCLRDDSLVYELGKAVGRQCRLMGINVDFAPDADVNTNPANPVIGTRSFGEFPENVARKAIAFSKGMESQGVLSVFKHFPGHGDTSTDSHKALPTVNHNRERLDSIELYPFRQAAAQGVGGMMVGHLEVPILEQTEGLPSSLSHNIIDILTKDYGYQGLVFTDALAMKGVAGFENVCLKALEAGNDVVLTPRPVEKQLRAVVRHANNDKSFRKSIERKCKKVLVYKFLLGAHKVGKVSADEIRGELAGTDVTHLIRSLYKAATTVVSDTQNHLPFSPKSQRATALCFDNKSQTFVKELQSAIACDKTNVNPATSQAATANLEDYSAIIVPISEATPQKSIEILRSLPQKKLVYVFFTPQKTIANYKQLNPAAASMVVANSNEAYMQRHVAAILSGQAKADARLSMTIPGVAAAGAGIDINPPTYARTETPEVHGMSSVVLERIDSIAWAGIKAKAYPGCQIAVMKDGVFVYDKCFGTLEYGSNRPVRPDNLYDVASVTKTAATLLAVMRLCDDGALHVEDPIGNYLPWLKGTDKENITIQELLFHESGLKPSLPFFLAAIDSTSYTAPFYSYRKDAQHAVRMGRNTYVPQSFSFRTDMTSRWPDPRFPHQVSAHLYTNKNYCDTALRLIAQSPLGQKRYAYSCVGFIVLKEIIEQVSGEFLDTYLYKHFYHPMGLTHTLFNPLKRFGQEQIAPTVETDWLRHERLQGFVHDQSAAFFGGVSGNAGLFSTAEEIALIYQMLLNGGYHAGRSYLSGAVCRRFTTSHSTKSRRLLGFDASAPGNVKGNPCSPLAPKGVFGHMGFTGTCVWADPCNNLVFVFLSNRTYPDCSDNKLARMRVRNRIQTTIYEALGK